MKGTRAVVAGAGLGGALIATQLARAGFDVEVVERRQDPRQTGRPDHVRIMLRYDQARFEGLVKAALAAV